MESLLQPYSHAVQLRNVGVEHDTSGRSAAMSDYVFGAQRSLVAQICNLPYRRIAFCGAPASAIAPELSDTPPIRNRRYGRLQIICDCHRCVTIVTQL
jgi:hypothetical protein